MKNSKVKLALLAVGLGFGLNAFAATEAQCTSWENICNAGSPYSYHCQLVAKFCLD
ncbi:MAG: hypothetical protein ACI8WB_003044 [Phenylobacterium sp.]|jgi:hypothetical protein